MSIEIINDENYKMPELLASNSFDEKLDAKIEINNAVNDALERAKIEMASHVENTYKYVDNRANDTLRQAEKLSQDILQKVKTELTGLAKPKIMAVKIGESETRKLTSTASPYLGDIVTLASLRMNILLVGPAGCGKTSLAAQLAEALGLTFDFVSLTAGASETWLLGRHTPNGFMPAKFAHSFANGGVFLLDEIDGADANTMMILNAALANGHMYNPMTGETITRHKDFVCIAAANTFGLGANGVYTGRNRLDAAFLDRFAGSTVVMDYSKDIEEVLCPNQDMREILQNARKKLQEMKAQQIISTRALANAYTLTHQAKWSFAKYINSLTASWPEGLSKQVGLV